MAAAVRHYLSRTCSLGWTALNRYRSPTYRLTTRRDDLSSLCRRFSSSVTLSNMCSPMVRPSCTVNNMCINRINGMIHQNGQGLLETASPTIVTARNKIYCSKLKGKPKNIKAVTSRFYRLDWGIWIRPKSGRAKRLWRKGENRKYRLRQHVFCNGQQSRLLDKMTSSFYKKKQFYVDDPYEVYQKRTNFSEYFPEKKPFYP